MNLSRKQLLPVLLAQTERAVPCAPRPVAPFRTNVIAMLSSFGRSLKERSAAMLAKQHIFSQGEKCPEGVPQAGSLLYRRLLIGRARREVDVGAFAGCQLAIQPTASRRHTTSAHLTLPPPRPFLALGLIQLLVLTGFSALAAPDYSAFKLVTERNIFSPSRTGRHTPAETRVTRPTAAVDSLTLVGVLESEKGRFAFFDGSNAQYRRTLPVGGTVAGQKVVLIQPGLVRLEGASNTVDLKVGSSLRREEDGPWRLSTDNATTLGSPGRSSVSDSASHSPAPATAAAASTPQPSDRPPDGPEFMPPPGDGPPLMPPGAEGQMMPPGEMPAPPPGGGSPEDEVLRRLMQRREQEIDR